MEQDSPWKEALEVYFREFMAFFFPVIHSEIDWTMGYTFLDKELERIVRDAETGRRIADKLVKVYLPEGLETWLLIHIEVQGYVQELFAERMYVYNYRLFDRYRVEIVSLAVLTDDSPEYRPERYHAGRWGCELTFRFPTVKVLDYAKNWETLKSAMNPFAIVVMAHLKAQELGKGREEERKIWKLRLTRMLYEKGYERKNVLELFRFIDWLMTLPEDLEKDFWDEVKRMEEDKKMPYVTSVERIGIKKGLEQGLEQGKLQSAREILLDVAENKFGPLPGKIVSVINGIEDPASLKSLLMEAISCENLDSFRNHLDM